MTLGLRGLGWVAASGCLGIVLGCSSHSYQTTLLKAEQLEREGNHAQALALYQRAVPKIPERSNRERSGALVQVGNCLTAMGRLNEALASYQQATDADPDNLEARQHLAEFFVAGGAPQMAAEHVSFILSRRPEDAGALGLLGTMESAVGHYAKAKELLEHSVKNDPAHPMIAVALAEIYNREDNASEARRVLLRAASATAELGKSIYAWLALGRLEEQEGQIAAAEVAYRSAVKADDSVLPNLRLAQFLQRSARIDEAEQVLKHVDQLRPAEPSALADFQLNAGRPQDAIKGYVTAFAVAPSSSRLAQDSCDASRSKDSLINRFYCNAKALLHLSGNGLVDSESPSEPKAGESKTEDGAPQSSLQNQVHESQVAGASPASGTVSTGVVSRLIEAQMQLDREHAAKKADTEKEPNAQDANALLKKYRALMEMDPAAAAVLESEAALSEGNLPEAEWKSSVALKRAPSSPAAHYIRGVVYIHEDKIAEAKNEWSLALEGDADYIPARLALARQNLQEQDLLTAEEHASSVVREEPANVEALCVYARVLLAQERFASARGIAKRALAVDEKSAEVRVILGQVAMQQHNYGSAFVEFEHAVLLDSHSAEAMDGLLEVYKHGVITSAALRKMERVAIAPPSSATLLEIAGRLFAEKHLFADAIRALHRTLEVDPARTTAALALAETYYLQGNRHAAAKVAVDAGKQKQLVPITSELVAAEAQERGDQDLAIRNYELAIQSGDSSGLVANNLAWAYAQRGIKLDLALHLASSAVERNPNNPAVLDTLGVVQLKRRAYSEAVNALEQAASLMDGDEWEQQRPEVYRHLADAYSGAGLPEQAARAQENAASDKKTVPLDRKLNFSRKVAAGEDDRE